jgi:tight adherence protein B
MAWSAGHFLALSLGCLLGGLAAGALLFQGTVGAVLLALACMCGPLLLVRRARSQRLQQIETQLPDALDMMGRALRAGHAFPTALKMVGDEMNAPIAEEFKAVFDEVNFGMSMQDALTSMANRVDLTDMRFFVIAVVIQRETGGNLAELLASISAIMRDRIKLMAQVRVLTAEGRMSAWILSLLPFGAAGLIHLTNPTFLQLLYTDKLGLTMLGISGALMGIGIMVMRNIIDIRV